MTVPIRSVVLCILTATFAAAHADTAWACSCVGSPTFEDEARRASIVLLGRVIEIGEVKTDDDPGSITIDVERTLKGAVQSSVVVVWNEAAGSSCGGLFSRLRVGSSVALAVIRVSEVEMPGDLWDVMDFHPPAGDLLVRFGCGQPLAVFATDRERERWLRRRAAHVDVSPGAAERGSPAADRLPARR